MAEKKKIFTLKNGISLLVTAGVGKVIDDAIDATAPEQIKLPAKILRKIGAWSLGWFIGDWAGEKAEEAYDAIEEGVKEVKEKLDEISNDAEEAVTESVEEIVEEVNT